MSDRFDDSPVSRRDFVRLSAATSAALALPGNATAETDSEAFDAEYRYVQNHTPSEHAVATLVTFSDESGPAAMESALSTEVVTTTEPRPAAYAPLTATQAETVADLPTADEFQFSPGSNPFWRIGYYPLGVFPAPRRSVDFVGFEQLKDGLKHLSTEHENAHYLRVRNVGTSPGHYNNVTDREDGKGMYVAELTDFESDTPFSEKEKVFFSCSLHGLEAAGREAGARFIEEMLEQSGQNWDVLGDLLDDDIVIILGFTNPDGWVARNPQYDSGWQLGGPGTGTPRVPAGTLYERGNAEVFDTNRQYPSVGYISPANYPAEPDPPSGRPPREVRTKVPDALGIVEHFRTYENLNYGADLHGGPVFADFTLGLVSQDQYDPREVHEVYAMCRDLDEQLEAVLTKWNTLADVADPVADRYNPDPFGFGGTIPESAFDYATIYDTIGYTVTGAMLDWMAHPPDLGGLGMTTLDFEMSFSHMTGGNVFNPELIEMEVVSYQAAIRVISKFAYRNTDTPSVSSTNDFAVSVESGGEDVAFVTPCAEDDIASQRDPLARRSDQLEFASFSEVDGFTRTGVVGPGVGGSTTVEEPFDTETLRGDPDTVEATLSWTTNTQDVDLYLEDPNGDRIAGSTDFGGLESLTAPVDREGEYTFVVQTYANVATQYELRASFTAPDRGDETDTATGSRSKTTTVAAEGSAAETFDVAGADLHSVTVHTHARSAVFDLELVDPAGETVRSFEGATEKRLGGKCCGFPEWHVADPEPGTWTVRIDSLTTEPKRAEIEVHTLSSAGPQPNPEEALGYQQYDYAVSPLRFLQDLREYVADGSVDAVPVDAVADGALSDYDHAVVIHDYGANGGRIEDGYDVGGYVSKVDEFVTGGGNLVLTDTGTRLLPNLDNELVDGSALGDGSFERHQYDVAHYGGKNLDHPLLTDVRPIQNQLWKVAPLGYAVTGEAPMYLLDRDDFESAARGVGSVAGTTDGLVATGSITERGTSGRGVHVVSSLLPPASQGNLHPFGLLDYTVSFLGYLVVTNALGFEQRLVSGEEEDTFGRGDDWNVDLSVTAARTDEDGSAFTGGQTNRVDLDVSVDREADVRDGLPDGWTVAPEHNEDVSRVEDGHVYFESTVDGRETFTYFAEAPDRPGQYTFGPVEASGGDGWTEAPDSTEDDYVVGPDQNTLPGA